MKHSSSFNAATGTSSEGFSRGTNKFAHNQWSGHSNDGREVNFGRGPTKGNQDYNARQGSHREAPTSALPAFKPGKDMFAGSANPQVRTPGGTKEFKKFKNADMINVGRGPTKGNEQ